MINVNELYLEVKNKWNSLYPIYFDSNKTIAEGIFFFIRIKVEDCPKIYVSKTPKYNNSPWQWGHYS